MDQDKSIIFEEHMDKINRYLTKRPGCAALWEGFINSICSRYDYTVFDSAPQFEMGGNHFHLPLKVTSAHSSWRK